MEYCESTPPRTFGAAVTAVVGLFVLLVLTGPTAYAAADVRILIDVSGSMKENDPRNLRVPAMRLMSELLPAGTTAGVWLFAEQAAELVAPGAVDEAWREQARRELPRIHSRGLFTHIERALDAATRGWGAPDSDTERHVVLLTDGVVDVSKVAAESTASRERILGAQLERLATLGVRVHAVALSDNVDQALMAALTEGTGGWFEHADDAARLQRIFLHMLEQAAPPVTVPLEGNRFDIDNSVSELTLLVFRTEDAAVTLTPPGGAAWSAGNHPAAVQWRNEAGYDLVTVTAPTPGSWQFHGTDDVDNRAVVVTDLALELERLAPTLLASAATPLRARLTSAGAPLARLELLELVNARSTLDAADGTQHEGGLALDRAQAMFHGDLGGGDIVPGVYRLTVTADGGTFKRQVNTRVRFTADPVSVRYVFDPSVNDAVAVEVVADPELTRPYTLNGYIGITAADGSTRAVALPPPVDGRVRLRVPASTAGGHELAPRLYVDDASGRTLRLAPAPAHFELGYAAPEPTTEAALAHTEALLWPLLAGLVGAGNLFLAGGLALVWLTLGRPRAAKEKPA
ncbi:MAG: vWA domain-containing protein [Gammaproteobacteria bacterium]